MKCSPRERDHRKSTLGRSGLYGQAEEVEEAAKAMRQEQAEKQAEGGASGAPARKGDLEF